MPNPFHASFGVSPPLLVGRESVLEDFVEALEDGPGSSGRASLYTGARGAGKTVMLNAVEDRARALGWLVVSETATAGFVDRMTQQHLPKLLREFDPEAVQRRLKGMTAPLNIGRVDWDTVERHVVQVGLRNQLEVLTDLLSEHGTGVLITLDEIHQNQLAELREIATTVQHAFREGRELAFAGAGLAASVADVVNDDVLTFLRRAERHSLGSVPRTEVERGFREPIEAAGRHIGAEALQIMVDGTNGYPFLLQLVGAQTWRLHPGQEEITTVDAAEGVARARLRLGALIHEPALSAASDIDKRFLLAMAHDDGPSKMADIQRRLAVDVNYASQYRLRLIAAELIYSTRRGYVDFALPYLREYLRDQATTDL
ncbi:AAA ATPase domain-containing protein [Nakamurella panacisegetis]|uniref:AAA ATPase domain-containing protein n=1 Tax=Nakamurella panacisegetis TaxID=1090615 RepID=A0A1H0LLQ0_9ACTN|nr:ATP-binding protein [Nakamurella panacisegetis]SDO69025.1 AAA ATPase domain-containing protein [Nakamurella panacisegetis]